MRGIVASPLVLLALAAPAAAAQAQGTTSARAKAEATTLKYVIRFYPRFLTSWLASQSPANRLLSPITPDSGVIGPKTKLVVLPNIDTVYAESSNIDLSQGPLVLTVPATDVSWSMQTMDVWGTDFTTGIDTTKAGVYGLVLPSFKGTLPAGVTKVVVPYAATVWFLRANRYTNNVNTVAAAKAFVAGIRLTSLSKYEANPDAGHVAPAPQRLLSKSSKVVADDTIRLAPARYLRQLQAAIHASSTAPLTLSDRRLSRAFDNVFGAAKRARRHGDREPMATIKNAARTAHARIVRHYRSHAVGGSEWIHFPNVANWGTAYLDRAATSEYILYGNPATTAVYYNAFTDGAGSRLDTRTAPAYRLTFSKDQIPQNDRFWSLTLYVSQAVTLFAPQYPRVPTKNVAEYTPGLVTAPDGSITVYIQSKPPVDPTLRPNWLPTPRGPFSVMLRVYSPVGNTAAGTYVPPEIRAMR